MEWLSNWKAGFAIKPPMDEIGYAIMVFPKEAVRASVTWSNISQPYFTQYPVAFNELMIERNNNL